MDYEKTLTEEITAILIDGGCTVNKPSVKKVVELIYQRDLGHFDGFEQHVTKQTGRMRAYTEDKRKREAEA